MKIFISYRRAEDDDTYIVGTLRKSLVEAFPNEVFRDTYDIPSGADWRAILRGEIESCQVMLVIIGPNWANLKMGDKKRLEDPADITAWEVETGLKRSTEGTATVIPVLVLGAQVPKTDDLPDRLRPLLDKNLIRIRNFPDYEHDVGKLIHDIETSQGFTRDGKPEHDFEPEMVYIKEGPFIMGNEPGMGYPSYEEGQMEVTLPAYRIGICPITNLLFECYLNKKEVSPHPYLGWNGQSVPEEMRELPVAGVTWFEALEYCKWLSQETGHDYSIPNEAQWEKACRGGGSSVLYPWGNEIDPTRYNHEGTQLAEVKAFLPQNNFGIHDLVGNIRQWTRTLWGDRAPVPDKLSSYPWKNDKDSDKRRNDPDAPNDIRRVVRGSSFLDSQTMLRCGARDRQLPTERGFPGKRYGFRVVRND